MANKTQCIFYKIIKQQYLLNTHSLSPSQNLIPLSNFRSHENAFFFLSLLCNIPNGEHVCVVKGSGQNIQEARMRKNSLIFALGK